MSLQSTLTATGAGIEGILLYAFIGAALMLIVCGAYGVLAVKDQRLGRMRALGTGRANETAKLPGPQLSKVQGARPKGLLKSLIPDDAKELSETQYQLQSIGFDGVNAVRNYFLTRLFLSLVVPLALLSLLGLNSVDALPQRIGDMLAALSLLNKLQIGMVGIAAGFYGPGYWLKARVKSRRDRVRLSFPNALDLLQISVESGLGFDAALSRVGTEIGRVSPDIAYELLLTQHEIQAGRDRESAMEDMARRMGIPEAMAFVTVVAQSMQFGTSLTQTLRVYASEMRQQRELNAQEKANKLPVQMSAVMSFMMLPALFLITLTPIIIRYMQVF